MATKIEEFSENVLGIKLTKLQVEIIKAVADGKNIVKHRQMGLATANRVWREYVKDGLAEPPTIAPVTNKHGQPIGDFPKDVPTQEEFDKAHANPLEYGDEGDWLIVSKAVDQHAAFEMIVAVMKDWGIDEESLPKDETDISTFNIGWGYDHDSYHYSEGGYWICSDENQISKRFEAWGYATQ